MPVAPLGLEEVYQSSLLNIDEGFNDTRFERDTTIARPHNLFLLPKMVEEDIPPLLSGKSYFLFSDEIPQNEEAKHQFLKSTSLQNSIPFRGNTIQKKDVINESNNSKHRMFVLKMLLSLLPLFGT